MLNTEDHNLSEKDLLSQAKNGNLAAFEKILFSYEKAIYNYILRLVKQKQDAEDLTQITFIKLYKSLKSIDPAKSFKSWLYKIATNTAYDWFRKKKREAELLVSEAEQCPETTEAEKTYYDIETAEILEQALAKIEPLYRSVILLYYKNDLTYQEIAEALVIPINTVKTHLRRAKAALKNELKINL